MTENRTIFIWDIQWCYNEFELLLTKLNLTEDDIVYLVWDIINRWPKSYKTLKYIYKNRKQFRCVLGNHEINFLKYLHWEWYDWDTKDFEKLKIKLLEKPAILEYLKNIPLYIETEDFILIHWGLIPWKKLEDHTIDEITRTRDYNWKPWYDYYDEKNKKIIYWHRALDWLRIRKNTIWIDSWCVYWKMLTAYILETWEIIQQQALNLYINVYWNASINI